MTLGSSVLLGIRNFAILSGPCSRSSIRIVSDWRAGSRQGGVVEGPIVYDRKRFDARVFETSGAHVPPGGLGCFSASYNPRSSEMKITVKVCSRFVSPDGQPVPATVSSNFNKAFEDKIPEYWNNRFRFVCTKNGFVGAVAKPVFEVVQSSLADAHYDLKIVNLERGNICVRQGEDPAVTASRDPKWDPYRNKLSAQFQLVAIQADTLTKARNLLTAIEKPVEVAVDTTPGHTLLSFAAMERLRAHAADVPHVILGKKKPKLTITGPSASGSDVAKQIGAALVKFGFAGELKYKSGGKPGIATIVLDPKQAANARAEIEGNVAQFPQYSQYAVVHEFGHMLGLPDEYMCCGTNTVAILAQHGLAAKSAIEQSALENNTTTKQQDFSAGIAKTQEEFVKLCSMFSVPVPPFGRANQSLMSAGHTFLPAHAVTVAHALWRMTQNYFTPKDWRIELIKA
jgi:hypothetical protein